jgi:hypothetical protein
MNCLTDYIGLRGCSSSIPPSGLYVNDLPGISLKQIVSLTNEEEKTYLELWEMIQRRAQNRFSLDVREQMGKAYKIKSINQGININGISTGTGTATEPNGTYYGFTLEYDTMDTGNVPSPLTYMHIQQIKFYSEISGNYNIEFIDIDAKTTIYSIYADLSIGGNMIEVNTTFTNVGRLFVGIQIPENDNYTSIKTTDDYWTGCCGVLVRGATFYDGTFSFKSELFGFSPIFTIGCSWDGLICQNKNIFSRPYWYLLGIEVLTEVIYSTKLNQFTTVNLQKANELRTEYQVEYMKALTQVAEGMNLDCDCCLECSGSVQLRETTQFY